jgi:uncharacterized lipoprotein YehR (DUF1307 family)
MEAIMMKRMFAVLLMFAVCLGLFSLQGCGESEQTKLEAERTRLEIEKLKREAEEDAARKKLNEEIFKTDKLENFKAKTKF